MIESIGWIFYIHYWKANDKLPFMNFMANGYSRRQRRLLVQRLQGKRGFHTCLLTGGCSMWLDYSGLGRHD